LYDAIVVTSVLVVSSYAYNVVVITKTMGDGIMAAGRTKYRVHQFDIHGQLDRLKLEDFLNRLEGEVMSIIPNIKGMSLFQIYGMTKRVDHLLIVEKVTFDE